MCNTSISRGVCRRFTACAIVALSFGLTLVTGCSNKTVPNAFATIVPGNTMVGTGTTFVMFAGASPTGVTWSISNGTGCPTSGCGTLTGATATSVNYVAPVSMPGSIMSVTVKATSTTNSSISASETLTVYPVSVHINGPSNTTVIPLTTTPITATVPGDLTGQGVTWSITGSACAGTTEGCGTFRGSTPTQVTYVAPPAPQFETITVTATSVYAPGESASITLSVPKLAIYVYTPTVLPAATAGQPYSATIQVVGNTPPYTFTFSNLPSWVTATTGPQLVIFSGTPPAGTQGTAYPTITVSDSTTPNPTISGQPFAITTYPAAATGNGLLAGSYAFFGTGWTDGTSVQTTYNGIEYIGSFTADGNGNITGGELDVNSPTAGLTSYASLGGTYNVQYGNDSHGNPVQGTQTGIVTLVPEGKPPLPITLAVSLGSIQGGVATVGHFVEFDDSTGVGANVTPNSSGIRAQGSLARQSTLALNSTTSPISGPYAFGMAGYSAVSAVTPTVNGAVQLGNCFSVHTCGPISLAGSMIFGIGGTVSSGIEDVMVAENNGSAIALSGSLTNSGNTDGSGRVTASITAAANANMPSWPSNFVMYAVNPQTFYFMSIDPYSTNSLIAGTAMQQNLADIASAPFSSTQPIVLYGNLTSTTSFSTKGPNGQIRVELQLLQPSPSSVTAGTMSGFQWVNASGTYTATATPGTVGNFSYTVSPNTGRVAVSTTGEPYLYLVDTNQGFGTQYSTANNVAPGLFQFQPQTATSLNPGNYTYYIFNGTSQLAPMETGVLEIPSGDVPADGSTVAVTGGQDYTAFGAAANVYVAGENILYSGPISGTLSQTSGLFSKSTIILPGTMQGCGQQTPQGGGWVISSTSFVCAPGGGSFAGIHVFQQ